MAIKALKGAFNATTSNGDVSYKYAIIQTFRGGVNSVSLDVFLSDLWIVETNGFNIVDETAPGVFKSVQFTPDWSSTVNLIDQAYAYLRTLPDFANTEDVI